MSGVGRALVLHGGGAQQLLPNDQIPRRVWQDFGMQGTGLRARAAAWSSQASAPSRGQIRDCRGPGRPLPMPRACLTRGHTGHRLSAHPYVHAPPQHRDQAAAVHQVSGRRGRAGLSQGCPSAGPDLHTHAHSALLESLINPLQERIEDWKKSVNQLDKDHAKGEAGASARVSTRTRRRPPPTERPCLTPCTEYKRARHEIKKKSSDTLKLQKKARKGSAQRCPSSCSPTGPHSLSPTSL